MLQQELVLLPEELNLNEAMLPEEVGIFTITSNCNYSQTCIIRRSMGGQNCAGLQRLSDYQIASTIRH